MATFAQAFSLIGRARHGNTDFYVIYRSVLALSEGASGELYAFNDAQTRWQRTLPPGALMFFQPLSSLSPLQAGIVWSVLNLLLIVGAAFALRSLVNGLTRQRRLHQATLPWMIFIFLVLAGGSIQVGQVSLLFTCCWIFYLAFSAKNREANERTTPSKNAIGFLLAGGLALAVPLVMKIYAVLWLFVPFSARRYKEALTAIVVALVVALVLPFAVYGPRTPDLNRSFVQNVLAGKHNRMVAFQNMISVSDQGLDSVLQRYLTDNPDVLSVRQLPHLHLSHETVRSSVQALRVLIVIFTALVALAWQRRRLADKALRQKNAHTQYDAFDTLQMAALWSSTLYFLLPGAKSRYAVYAFLGFYPLLVAALAAQRRFSTRRATQNATAQNATAQNAISRFRSRKIPFFIAFCLVTIALIIPRSMRILGFGLLGSGALWVANISHVALLDRKKPSRLRV